MFPVIKNINDVLPYIKNIESFIVVDRDYYKIIDYVSYLDNPFYIDDDYHSYLIRRECRGIIFDSNTGNIIRRPYHKFFNLNETEHTLEKNVKLTEDNHICLNKLDGSMIAPFFIPGSEDIYWGTRLASNEFHNYIIQNIENLDKITQFSKVVLQAGFTPIFELLTPQFNQIVLKYHHNELRLTAIRNMISGEYLTYTKSSMAHANDIKHVQPIKLSLNISDITKDINDLCQNNPFEGVVIRFNDGEMIKVKTDWYVAIHKAKEKILYDRYVVKLFLEEKLDDVMPHLPEDDIKKLVEFKNQLSSQIITIVNDAYNYMILNSNQSKKDFSLGYGNTLNDYLRSFYFKLFDIIKSIGIENFDMHIVYDTFVKLVLNNCNNNTKWSGISNKLFNGIKFNYMEIVE